MEQFPDNLANIGNCLLDDLNKFHIERLTSKIKGSISRELKSEFVRFWRKAGSEFNRYQSTSGISRSPGWGEGESTEFPSSR